VESLEAQVKGLRARIKELEFDCGDLYTARDKARQELTAEIEQSHHFASERDEAETKLTAERTRGVALRDEMQAHRGPFAPVWIMKAIAAYDAGAGAKP
jgi:chromosome segregation ATPase